MRDLFFFSINVMPFLSIYFHLIITVQENSWKFMERNGYVGDANLLEQWQWHWWDENKVEYLVEIKWASIYMDR